MCESKRKLFCLSLLFLSFSVLAFSQEVGSPLSVKVPSASSEQSSPDSLLKNVPTLPEQPTLQIDPLLPLEKRQALMLKAWIEWYGEVKTYSEQVTSWSNQVADSWTKAKDSYEKVIAAQVLQINSRDVVIESLNERLRSATLEKWLYGGGGFAAGYAAGRLTK